MIFWNLSDDRWFQILTDSQMLDLQIMVSYPVKLNPQLQMKLSHKYYIVYMNKLTTCQDKV